MDVAEAEGLGVDWWVLRPERQAGCSCRLPCMLNHSEPHAKVLDHNTASLSGLICELEKFIRSFSIFCWTLRRQRFRKKSPAFVGLTVRWWRLPGNYSTIVQEVRYSMEAGPAGWGPGFGAGSDLGSKLGSGECDREYES